MSKSEEENIESKDVVPLSKAKSVKNKLPQSALKYSNF